jgi:hypothetical protein
MIFLAIWGSDQILSLDPKGTYMTDPLEGKRANCSSTKFQLEIMVGAPSIYI